MKNSRLRVAFIFIFVIFQHFEIFSAGGYPVTVGLVCAASLLLMTAPPRAYPSRIHITLLALFILSALPLLREPVPVSTSQYLRTLLLFVVAILITCNSGNAVGREWLRSNTLHKALVLALALIVLLSVAQVALGSRGSEALFNLFGPHQYLYEYDPHLEFSPVPRAQGFYLEPSYNAFVIGSLSVILLCVSRYKKHALLLCLIGQLVTQSATGLTIFLALLVVFAFKQRGSASFVVVVILPIIAAIAGPYLWVRLTSINTYGSSANYRLQSPLLILSRVVTDRPEGFPMGSLSSVVASYDLANGADRGTSLDNGFYVLIFYFGWAGALLIMASLVSVLYRVLFSPKSATGLAFWLVPAWLLSSFMFSGGIMLPEFAFTTWMVISCTRPIRKTGSTSARAQEMQIAVRVS